MKSEKRVLFPAIKQGLCSFGLLASFRLGYFGIHHLPKGRLLETQKVSEFLLQSDLPPPGLSIDSIS